MNLDLHQHEDGYIITTAGELEHCMQYCNHQQLFVKVLMPENIEVPMRMQTDNGILINTFECHITPAKPLGSKPTPELSWYHIWPSADYNKVWSV